MVIADNVGDNVGDCAGMAADLFETFCVTAAAAMLLAHIIFPGNETLFLYPLVVGAAGIIGTLISLRFVVIDEPVAGQQPGVMGAMYLGLAVSIGVPLRACRTGEFEYRDSSFRRRAYDPWE